MSNKTHEVVEILGIEHHLAVDPESLNEAGVVWTPAVRALASAVAPIIEARQASHSLATSSSDADGTPARGPPR
jgi:nicotinamide mononucleotide (NMN) deamidase PncC